jgi:hypothetical protein
VWHYEKSGIFTVKSAYLLSVQIREQERVVCNTNPNNMGERSIWTLIGRQKNPQKIKIFLWRVVNNALATKLSKWKSHLEVENFCELCGLETESEFHALVSCGHVRNLRLALRKH